MSDKNKENLHEPNNSTYYLAQKCCQQITFPNNIQDPNKGENETIKSNME